MTHRDARLGVSSIYVVAAGVAVIAYLVSAFVLALAFPYHDWDAFSLGAWSISIAHGHVDPIDGGVVGAARPLFFWLQGALWSVTGVSFVAGRLLGLGFAVALLGDAWLLTRAATGAALEAALAVIAIIAIPAFAQEAIQGKTDVPAAAAVAVVGWLALRSSDSRRATLLVGIAAFLAVLVKQTVFVPLAALALFVFFAGPRRTASVGLCGGLALGAVYEWVEVRQLGWHGLWNRAATMNIVLPSVQSALATATPALGEGGTLVTDDPSFQYFLPPGRVHRTFALHCRDVAGNRVFIFLTSDEVSYVASHAEGLVTPAQWARCTDPKLTQLTDGSNGYVVFAVAPSTG